MLGICALCSKAVDSVYHLFFHCIVWKNVIDIIKEQYHITPSFQSDDLCSYLEKWTDCFSKNSAYYYLPFLAMWVVWKVRNISIFEGKNVPVTSIFHHITCFSHMYCPSVIKVKKSRTIGLSHVLVYPCGFFDGASAQGAGGAGYVLILSEAHTFEFELGAGPCTNTKAELIGLWALLHTTQMMGIPKLRIYGDSLVIINWAKGTTSLSPPELHHWCRDTRKLCSCFLELSYYHIYREYNRHANCLSKKSLSLAPGIGRYSEFFDGHLASHDKIELF